MKADIVACYATTWVSKLIQWVTGAKITHVAIKVSDTLIMESSWFGVKLSKLSCYEKEQYTILRCNDLTHEERIQIVEYVLNRVGTAYDYKLLFGLGINHILRKMGIYKIKTQWDNPNKDICIELIIDGYRSINKELLPEIANADVEPIHITRSSLLTIIKEQ